MRNVYRFIYEHEFADGFAPGQGMGVYVEGQVLPFVLFRKTGKGQQGTARDWITCYDGTVDGVWGIVKWLDEPPEQAKKEEVELASMEKNLTF